jgi:hypothetical protein
MQRHVPCVLAHPCSPQWSIFVSGPPLEFADLRWSTICRRLQPPVPHHNQPPAESPPTLGALPHRADFVAADLATADLTADDIPTAPMIRIVRRPEKPPLVR